MTSPDCRPRRGAFSWICVNTIGDLRLSSAILWCANWRVCGTVGGASLHGEPTVDVPGGPGDERRFGICRDNPTALATSRGWP